MVNSFITQEKLDQTNNPLANLLEMLKHLVLIQSHNQEEIRISGAPSCKHCQIGSAPQAGSWRSFT
jgi:hypothetical protein